MVSLGAGSALYSTGVPQDRERTPGKPMPSFFVSFRGGGVKFKKCKMAGSTHVIGGRSCDSGYARCERKRRARSSGADFLALSAVTH